MSARSERVSSHADRWRYTPAHGASPAERLEALQRGALSLFARWPKVQADITVPIGPNNVAAHATMLFAGVVLVTVAWSGHVIARSKPGQPYVLDPACL